MRGKDQLYPVKLLPDGITPAYAGKRERVIQNGRCNEDHPRLCGEKLDVENNAEAKAGSPPPMRGKAKTDLFDFFEIRITPAYAGKSLSQVVIPAWD